MLTVLLIASMPSVVIREHVQWGDWAMYLLLAAVIYVCVMIDLWRREENGYITELESELHWFKVYYWAATAVYVIGSIVWFSIMAFGIWTYLWCGGTVIAGIEIFRVIYDHLLDR